MKPVKTEDVKPRPRCDCGVHWKGRCDQDFPGGRGLNGWSADDYREYAARLKGLPEVSVTDPANGVSVTSLSVTKPLSVTSPETVSVTPPGGPFCESCGQAFEAARSTAKFCSDACRKKASRTRS